MENSTFDEVLTAAQSLPPESRRRLGEELLASLNSESPGDKINELNRQLLEAGLLSEIRKPAKKSAPFAPVTVIGQPVSETIIEERR